MAAKTVVCPECGAAAAPGRYACAECGTLLASVAVTPRSWSADDGGETRVVDLAADVPAELALPHDAGAWDVEAAPVADAPADAAADVVASVTDLAPRPAAVTQADALPADSGSPAFDEDAPLGSAGVEQPAGHAAAQPAAHAAAQPAGHAAVPDVLHDVADAVDHDNDRPLALDDRPLGGAATDRAAGPRDEPEPEPENETDADNDPHVESGSEATIAASAAPVAPIWPPVGDRGVVPPPETRTPAGSYLPPSAVLPPLDGGMVAAPAASSAAPAGGSSDRAAAAASAADRASATLVGAFDRIRVGADGARAIVAVGAGLAAIGVLLPRVDGLAGQSPFAGYFDRWFLGVPGMWIVLLGLVVLTLIASSSGRVASWPVGLPAIVAAAFLVGLVWPSLAGGFGGAIGIWLVLVGAIVLAIGGTLVRRVRHDVAEPSVPTSDGGGR